MFQAVLKSISYARVRTEPKPPDVAIGAPADPDHGAA
jgi:hypothetical protein